MICHFMRQNCLIEQLNAFIAKLQGFHPGAKLKWSFRLQCHWIIFSVSENPVDPITCEPLHSWCCLDDSSKGRNLPVSVAGHRQANQLEEQAYPFLPRPRRPFEEWRLVKEV